MKRIISFFAAVVLCAGCAHLKSTHAVKAPAKPSAVAQAPAKPSVTAQAPAKPSVTAQAPAKPYGTAQAPAKPYVTAQAPAKPYVTAQAPAKPYVASTSLEEPSENLKFLALFGPIMGVVFGLCLLWMVFKYVVPLFKKLLARVKASNIHARLKILEIDAKNRLEADVTKIKADVAKIIGLLLVCSLFCGCVHLPNTGQVSKGPSVAGAPASGSPAHKAIQAAVNWEMTLCILGGLACLAFGGLAIYGGQLLPGIKLVVAGLLLPVFGIWWAYHWLLVTIIVLICGAAYMLITHYAVLRPALVSVETWAKSVEARLAIKPVSTPATAHEVTAAEVVKPILAPSPTPFRKTE